MPYISLNLLCYPDADLERGTACACQINLAIQARRLFAESEQGLALQCAWHDTGREAPC